MYIYMHIYIHTYICICIQGFVQALTCFGLRRSKLNLKTKLKINKNCLDYLE